MTSSTNKFKSALRESVSKEFAHVPTDENSIVFTFSKQFEKQMDKLIKSQRKIFYSFVNTAFKRVAVILLICITMLTAAFSIKAIREPIVNFIKRVYSTFTHYSFEGDTVEKIRQEYTIKVPDDFKQTNIMKTDSLITTEYTNTAGDVIEFSQMTTEYSGGYFVNNENGDIISNTVNGIKVEFKEQYDTKSAIWATNEYVFEIICYGNIDYEIIEAMIISLS